MSLTECAGTLRKWASRYDDLDAQEYEMREDLFRIADELEALASGRTDGPVKSPAPMAEDGPVKPLAYANGAPDDCEWIRDWVSVYDGFPKPDEFVMVLTALEHPGIGRLDYGGRGPYKWAFESPYYTEGDQVWWWRPLTDNGHSYMGRMEQRSAD